jgi:hypothetical protein
MSYSSPLPDFPRNIITLAAAAWFTPTQLLGLANALRMVLFPIVDQRAAGFSVLSNITFSSPFAFSPPVRFPASSAFATDFDPVLTKLLSQLRAALSFKDRYIATSSTGVTDRQVTALSPEYVASFNAFQTALSDLYAYALLPSNYYDRLSFEEAFSLIWS